jgi:hypothetical protein
MTHPKKLQAMLERLKWQDLAGHSTVLCEYQIEQHLDEYEIEDDSNFKQLFLQQMYYGDSALEQAFYELVKDKTITYLGFCEQRIGYDEREWTEYKHPNYTERFLCDNVEDYAEEITPESHAKLLFEIANGDYDDVTGEYLGYSGDYADFSDPV